MSACEDMIQEPPEVIYSRRSRHSVLIKHSIVKDLSLPAGAEVPVSNIPELDILWDPGNVNDNCRTASRVWVVTRPGGEATHSETRLHPILHKDINVALTYCPLRHSLPAPKHSDPLGRVQNGDKAVQAFPPSPSSWRFKMQ